MSDKKLPKRSENYAEWYQELVKKADLAEHSAVKGCMVIKPYGYTIWENMQQQLDKMFKETGHTNAYFPLFVPKSFLEKEEGHAEGFAKECAVVTHYRLKANPAKKGALMVDSESKLEEELIVRPTSEAVIWNTYKNWIQSYRDLPLLINQWANVVRWEMRTRLFLRTTEFLWQEGHTAHATADEAVIETKQMLDVYAEFVENFLALPVIKGVKTANERFAGALDTYCIEALMQDGKALQAGTSHFLGQNFAKAFDVKFLNKQNQQEYVWGTSWGVSTRLMGALVMAHSDDNGLVLPPAIAPFQVVIIPIGKSEEQLAKVIAKITEIQQLFKAKNIRVKLDNRDNLTPGFKFADWELRGVPVRLALGERDIDNGTIEVARRDKERGEEGAKTIEKLDSIVEFVEKLLTQMQEDIYQKALSFRNSHITEVNSFEEFKKVLETKGGFVAAHWDGTSETEIKIKEQTKATIRCIPLDSKDEAGVCIFSGRPSQKRVLFAQAY
ncbi:MAG: proline--tRNA ligase [Cytophagales bacterium]|nr:MAG: proline--tRNA ligase [Cytophagales bacterium]